MTCTLCPDTQIIRVTQWPQVQTNNTKWRHSDWYGRPSPTSRACSLTLRYLGRADRRTGGLLRTGVGATGISSTSHSAKNSDHASRSWARASCAPSHLGIGRYSGMQCEQIRYRLEALATGLSVRGMRYCNAGGRGRTRGGAVSSHATQTAAHFPPPPPPLPPPPAM